MLFIIVSQKRAPNFLVEGLNFCLYKTNSQKNESPILTYYMALGNKNFAVGGNMSELIKIEFLNWEKYQGKGKHWNNASWFRIQNNLDEHPLYDLLNDAEFRFFIFLMCLISRRAHKDGTVETMFNTLSRTSSVKKNDIKNAIKKLESLQILKTTVSVVCPSNVRGMSATLHNITLHNKYTCSLAPRASENDQNFDHFDFETLYAAYPRKIGKKRGMQICNKRIRNQADFDALRKAIDNYAMHCKHEKTETQYIKHFSTFMNSYEDWIEVEKQELQNDYSYLLDEVAE